VNGAALDHADLGRRLKSSRARAQRYPGMAASRKRGPAGFTRQVSQDLSRSCPAVGVPLVKPGKENQATNDPAPSLRPRYKGFIATTNRSASASRDGTQPLAVQPLGDLPAGQPQDGTGQYRDTPSPVPCGSRRPGSRRLHAGHHLASKRISARLIPESPKHPGFDVVLEFRHVSNDSLALAFPVPA
jgi:hypothetical protein